MLILLVPLIALLVYFFARTDSSLNLFFWSRTGTRSEAAHYADKVVWLVGASSGIGEQFAYRVAAFSPLLILSARRTELLEKVAARCREINPSCRVAILPVDITDFASLTQKCKEANKIFDREVELLFLNAGRTQRAEWTDIEPRVDEECFKVNTIGPVQLARAMLTELGLHTKAARVGNIQILVMSSIAAYTPAMLSPSYSAAKAALNAHFRVLAAEMGEKGVKVTIVAPSLVFVPEITKSAFTSTAGEAHGEVLARPTRQHLTPERAVELTSLAAIYELQEVIIAARASMFVFVYLYRIAPGVVTRIINAVGVERVKRIRAGKEDF